MIDITAFSNFLSFLFLSAKKAEKKKNNTIRKKKEKRKEKNKGKEVQIMRKNSENKTESILGALRKEGEKSDEPNQ